MLRGAKGNGPKAYTLEAAAVATLWSSKIGGDATNWPYSRPPIINKVITAARKIQVLVSIRSLKRPANAGLEVETN